MTGTATIGRPSKLTPALTEAFATCIAEGLTLERTCHHLGINDGTWRNWRAQGEHDIEQDLDTPFARLLAAVQEARLSAERTMLEAILAAVRGYEQVTVRTTTSTKWLRVYDEDTERWTYKEHTETQEVTERRQIRDWRAALAWLERTQPETYARVTRQWISGPSGDGPVEISVEEMRSKVDAELQELAEKMAGLPMPGDLRELPGPLAEGPPVG